MQRSTVTLSDDGITLSDGMVWSPYGKQCCSELMPHPPGEGPQLCFPELCFCCWAPSSLMDCEAQLLKFFSSLAVAFCSFFSVSLGCSSSVCCGRLGESQCFSRKEICRFVGCGTPAVVRFTTGLTPLVGLGGFYTSLEHVCVAKAKLWQWTKPPKHREAGNRPTAVKVSLWSVFLATPVNVLAIDDKRTGLNF